MRVSLLLSLCIPLLFLSASNLLAAPKVLLRVNMPVDEVVTVWGPPTNKVIKETKREIVYEYPQARLLVRNGKVIRWKVIEEKFVALPEPKRLEPEKPVIADAGERSAVESILTEIISESTEAPAKPAVP